MIKSMVLAWYGSYEGGAIGDMLVYWEQYGFFSYLLPFLLIFSLVFGILEKTKIFDQNRSINGIIAFVVGLMALQFGFVSQFFAEIFPRLGVALAIILVLMILLGIFLPTEKWVNAVLFLAVAVVLVVVLVKTAGAVGWFSGWWWSENWPMIAGIIFIIAVIGAIVGGASKSTSTFDDVASTFMRGLKGGK